MTDRAKKLAAGLSISDKDLAKLTKDLGAKLEATLARWEKETRDEPRLLRRSLPRGTAPTDELSEPSRLRAAEESAYTHSSFSSLSREGEAVDFETQQRFSREGWQNWGVVRAADEIKNRARTESNHVRELTNRALKLDKDPKTFLDRIWQARQEFERELERAA